MTTAHPRRTFWRFVVVGMANTFAGLAFIYGARALGLGEVAANATGYAIGLMLSFGLNRQWTFRQRGPLLPHVLRFASVMLLAWLINVAVLLGLMRWGVSAVLAQAGAVLPYTVVGYLGCRWWVFANRLNRMEGERT
ncbi:Putative flippase GtrA (transmembrane translocase of bactoprenol-linked glucose) [Formivibrio citricus]|uniref:Flippase GtrA (Transmembrane translocase of bactoprenol-linked glucose) n=1 Tax=Formivibrio citricus TaxID=83765 RepID=A0A1I4WYF5_9NEIS|nr:GtrA family protein [Formivibrio citricus]SFN18422.1 Putative flippase GtrA (transmembrane translocase of bactoprenol-linked glucose) [Formivibrio citricus]